MSFQVKALRPLDEQVERMARRGDTADDIADILGLSRRTLYRRGLQQAMARGRAQLRQNLRHAQLKSALIDRNPSLLMWLGKQLLGQREDPIVVEHTGTVQLMSGDEARAELHRKLARIAAADGAGSGDPVPESRGDLGAPHGLRLLGEAEPARTDEP
jgi:hypothetical protein